MNCDMHVHTRFSCDSSESIEGYCQAALEKGVRCVCFTDHVDYNPADYGFGYYDARAYFESFNRARDAYGDRLELLCGIEFAEPHVYGAQLDALAKLPYDFIIGSVHFWKGGLFPSEMRRAGVPAGECFDAYWEELFKAVSRGGFDCVGHFDFPKRYYDQLLYGERELAELFARMIKNDIVLEINTSSLRYGLDEALPGAALLELYRRAGGRYFTMGSDAHAADELYAGIGDQKRMARALGLREVYFKRRERFAL